LCPIGPAFCNVNASPPVYPVNPRSRESDRRNIVSESFCIAPPYGSSTSRTVPVSPPISLPRRENDCHHHCYRSSRPAHDTDRRNHDSKSITSVAHPTQIMARSASALCPIVTPRCTNYAVDRSCPSSHSARKSDHEGATYEHDDAAVPRVPVAPSPTIRAAVYAIPAHHGHSPDVVTESRGPLATAQGVSEEIRGNFGRLSAVGEPSALRNPFHVVSSTPPAAHIPLIS